MQQEITFSREDEKETSQITSEAITTGYESTHDEWKAMAARALFGIAQTHETFTVNDVRKIVNASDLQTHDRRAMGGVMMNGKRQGWIAKTGRSIPSKVGHFVPIQIWRSLIYKK